MMSVMSTGVKNEQAQPGDKIGKDELQPVSDELIAMAKSLEPDIGKADSVQQLAKLMKVHGDLLAHARKLIEGDIALIVGEAKISADQVRAAVKESERVIANVGELKSKLAKIGAVLDFVATVLTGSGTQMFEAAFALKDELNKP